MAGIRRSYGRRWADAVRHPARRDGAVLWMLLVLPWVAGLVLTRRHHLDAGGWGVVLTVSIGLSTLWVTWAAFRDARRAGEAATRPSLAPLADELAAAVGEQWAREAAVRRLNDPYPLPVSWTAAAADLAVAWESLSKLAATGAGWPRPVPGRAWALGPAELAGKGGELAGVLGKVPTGRLVVLGEPGSGKTMLMVRLVLDLLAGRAGGEPVPVLAPLASWDPSAQDLREWLATRMVTDYPALAGPPPAGAAGPTRAAALLSAGLVLPVLDGLDEIPESARAVAIGRINGTLQPGQQIVVTCRTQQYRDAIRPPDGPEAALAGAATIELRPLDVDVVCSYLRDDAPGPVTRARWDPVLKLLGTQAPVGQALSTPLMVALARTIYSPRPGEAPATMPDPVELCGLPSRTAVEAHLFDAFILAAYRPSAIDRWKAGQAERWLVFLARHLEHTIGTPDLAWWQLDKAAPRTVLRLAFGLVVGLVVGLVAGLAFSPVLGLVAGPGIMLTIGFASEAELPARGVRVSTTGLAAGLTGALPYGLAGGLVAGFAFRPVFGLVAGLTCWLTIGLAAGLTGVPSDIAEAVGPRIALARDRQVVFLLTLVPALTFELAIAVVYGLTVGLVAGLMVGLATGLGFGLNQTRWMQYTLARGWLAFRRQLPWPLMDFLADAQQRGVLRQAGTTYQFRHLELQHRLATRGHSQP